MARFTIILSKEAERQWEVIQKTTANERVLRLLESMEQNPRSGIGKPKLLKDFDEETWSRRIDRKNRIVYIVRQHKIYVVSILGHYQDK